MNNTTTTNNKQFTLEAFQIVDGKEVKVDLEANPEVKAAIEGMQRKLVKDVARRRLRATINHLEKSRARKPKATKPEKK